MFVDPVQVIQVQKRHAELGKVRLVVDRENQADVMTLHAEIKDGGSPDLAATIEGTIQTVDPLVVTTADGDRCVYASGADVFLVDDSDGCSQTSHPRGFIGNADSC